MSGSDALRNEGRWFALLVPLLKQLYAFEHTLSAFFAIYFNSKSEGIPNRKRRDAEEKAKKKRKLATRRFQGFTDLIIAK
jgi:hypothetical protein